MTRGSYGQFCPVAMAAEVLCTRWTFVVMREILAGNCRFNDLRRGAPRMSPALLSQRLKELEAAGVIERRPATDDPGVMEYRPTPAGEAVQGMVDALGHWGQRFIDKELSLQRLDAQLLMWDMRRGLNPSPLPPRRCVIQFRYPEQPTQHRVWWLVVTPQDGADLCSIDPGFDVDLYVSCALRTMTEIWMGHLTTAAALRGERLQLVGDAALARDIQTWLGLSPFASSAAAQ